MSIPSREWPPSTPCNFCGEPVYHTESGLTLDAGEQYIGLYDANGNTLSGRDIVEGGAGKTIHRCGSKEAQSDALF
jgi:hypothetical protein